MPPPTCIEQLEKNPEAVYEEVSELLLKIANNILKDPSNPRVRILRKSNAIVSKKILQAVGGLECLISMGFKEVGIHKRFFESTSRFSFESF